MRTVAYKRRRLLALAMFGLLLFGGAGWFNWLRWHRFGRTLAELLAGFGVRCEPGTGSDIRAAVLDAFAVGMRFGVVLGFVLLGCVMWAILVIWCIRGGRTLEVLLRTEHVEGSARDGQ